MERSRRSLVVAAVDNAEHVPLTLLAEALGYAINRYALDD